MNCTGNSEPEVPVDKLYAQNYIYFNPRDTGLDLYGVVHTYIEYYHKKKHQGIEMKSNDAYFKSLNQNAAKYSTKY